MNLFVKMKEVAQLSKMKAILVQKRTLYDRIGIQIIRWISKNFEQEGIEKKWTPLRSSTLFGRRAGSGKVLQNTGRLKQEASYKASESQVIVGWPTESIARYHHFGTKGPYEIRPRNKRALRFFAPPMSMISGGGTRTTLQRRGKGTPNVAGVSAASARLGGLNIPKGKGGIQSVAFAQVVRHPGLPVRALLPSQPLAKQLAQAVIDDALKGVTNG
jgi:phage gpG-like protein